MSISTRYLAMRSGTPSLVQASLRICLAGESKAFSKSHDAIAHVVTFSSAVSSAASTCATAWSVHEDRVYACCDWCRESLHSQNRTRRYSMIPTHSFRVASHNLRGRRSFSSGLSVFFGMGHNQLFFQNSGMIFFPTTEQARHTSLLWLTPEGP